MSGKTTTRSRRLANPYIGPKPFTSQEQDRFFGRTEEIAILEGLVLSRRVTLLFAQSGAGKSSILNAGLIPTLQQTHTVGYGVRKYKYQKMHVLPVLSVGGGIPADVRQEAVANVYVFSALLTLYPQKRQRRKLLKLSLAEGLKAKLDEMRPTPALDLEGEIPDTLLIFDQFEELFTRHQEYWQQRSEFFSQVRAALDQLPALRILFSMREDYIAELTPYAGLLPDKLSAQFRLERLRERAALDAIRLPAERAGRPFVEGAAELLVKRLRSSQLPPLSASGTPTPEPVPPPAAPPDAMLTEFVEPVQLQVVCQRLWNKLPVQHKNILPTDVEQYGDVQVALLEFYEQALADALDHHRTTGTAVSELRLRSWFDRQMITPAGTRSLVYKGETATGGLPNPVVEFLDYAVHIIRPMIRGKDTWYELTHDRLVALIRRSNQAWRRDHAAAWQLQAERWEREGKLDTLLLLTEETLTKAQQWLIEQQYTPEPYEQNFLDYSRQLFESTRKRQAQETEKRLHLAETGWGVIFAQDDPQAAAIRSALQELLDWRQQKVQARFKLFGLEEPRGYIVGESAQQFLLRLGVGPGLVNYERVPYYLLLIGDPVRIPFEFQYALQTQYSVGRLTFATLAEYANYPRSVVQSENGSFSLLPKVTLFGLENPVDAAAGAASTQLFTPLLNVLQSFQQDRDWEIETFLQAEATKAHLRDLLGGPATPALLFSSSHGLALPSGDPKQPALQGAILCQAEEPVLADPVLNGYDAYFAGHDLATEARLLGSIAFLYSGCSAGAPHLDNFPTVPAPPAEIAPVPFIADLPQRLLVHAQGGMVAVVGHVDQSWTTGFSWQGVELGISHFSSVLRRLMEGYTVGAAVEPLNQRYALLAAMLAGELQQIIFYSTQRDPQELAPLNVATVDTRNFIILGDPAARLPLEDGPVMVDRPLLTPVNQAAELGTLESMPARQIESALPDADGSRAALAAKAITADQARSDSDLLLYYNGINGLTGEYWSAPFTLQVLIAQITRERSPDNLSELQVTSQRIVTRL